MYLSMELFGLNTFQKSMELLFPVRGINVRPGVDSRELLGSVSGSRDEEEQVCGLL